MTMTATKPLVLGLNKQVKAWMGLRLEPPRRHGYHPSEAHYLCPALHYFVSEARDNLASADPQKVQEAWAFLRLMQNSKAKMFNPRVRMEFRIGDAVHADVQFYLGVLGVLWGRWKCPFCRLKTKYMQMPRVRRQGVGNAEILDAAPCVRCQGGNLKFDNSWEYIEPHVHSDNWGVEGHCDGDVRVTREEELIRLILEIKSINENGYHERYGGKLPLERHVTQASIYGWMMGVDQILFIYVNKNQVNEWKEFIVPVDQGAIAKFQENIRAVEQARQIGQPPLHARVCPDPREKRAKECPAFEKCFGCTRGTYV